MNKMHIIVNVLRQTYAKWTAKVKLSFNNVNSANKTLTGITFYAISRLAHQ